MMRTQRPVRSGGSLSLDPLRDYTEDQATAIVNALCEAPEGDDPPDRRRDGRRRYGISGFGAMVLSLTLLTVGFSSGGFAWHQAYTRVAVAEKTAALEQEYADRLEDALVAHAEGAALAVEEGEWSDAIQWLAFIDGFVKDGVMSDESRAEYRELLDALERHLGEVRRELDESTNGPGGR